MPSVSTALGATIAGVEIGGDDQRARAAEGMSIFSPVSRTRRRYDDDLALHSHRILQVCAGQPGKTIPDRHGRRQFHES
jgi:hypothetical protein